MTGPRDRLTSRDHAGGARTGPGGRSPSWCRPRGRPGNCSPGWTSFRALCWVAACLAEALHYAHERGLGPPGPEAVERAAGRPNGTPMLLDFHLARPAPRGGPAPAPGVFSAARWEYMSPRAAASFRGRPPAASHPATPWMAGPTSTRSADCWVKPSGCRQTEGHSPAGSVGLSDLVRRCLEPAPGRRYPKRRRPGRRPCGRQPAASQAPCAACHKPQPGAERLGLSGWLAAAPTTLALAALGAVLLCSRASSRRGSSWGAGRGTAPSRRRCPRCRPALLAAGRV